ncbi:unnamed protein product [Orchesella dallaii]|uniref:Uncharacterized protein n=1 Tax=Orchesella dallaii TaxID=48710 RepID=A0ABP1RV93_9HEXA
MLVSGISMLHFSLFLISASLTSSYGSVLQFPNCHKQKSKNWLIHGNPPNCFEAGKQGPCSDGELLLALSDNSMYGICKPDSTTEVPKPLRQRRSSSYKDDEEYYDDVDDDLDYHLTKAFLRNLCKSRKEKYSFILGRCIPIQKSQLKFAGILG